MGKNKAITLPVFVLLAFLAFFGTLGFSSNDLQVSISPEWVNSISEQAYTISFSSLDSSEDSVNEIRIPKPALNETKIVCGKPPVGWDLASPFGTAICAYATSEAPILPGSSLEITLKASFASDPMNFTVIAKDDGTVNTQGIFLLEVKLDSEAPLPIKIASPASESWERQGRGVYFDVTASDSGSGISSCEVVFGDAQLGSLNYSKSDERCSGIVYLPEKTPEGRIFLFVVEKDFAGNERKDGVPIIVDNTPPKISNVEIRDISGLAPGFLRPGSDFELTASIEDKGSGFSESTVEADISKLTGDESAISVNPTSCGLGSCKWVGKISGSAKDGEVLDFVVFASDKAGSGIALADSSAIVDFTPPEIVAETHLDDITSRSKIPFVFSVSDAQGGSGVSEAGILISVDGAEIEKSCEAKCRSDLELADGKHTIEISARDNSGNYASKYAREITVDTKGPSIGNVDLKYRIFSSLSGAIVKAEISDLSTDVKRAFAVHSGVEIELERKGSTWEGVIVPKYDLKSTDEIEIFAEDYAGNKEGAKVEENLSRLVTTGILSHIFGAILVLAFLYWAYSRTIKKRKVVGHFESYKPETLGEKIEKFWFDLSQRFGKKGVKKEPGKGNSPATQNQEKPPEHAGEKSEENDY